MKRTFPLAVLLATALLQPLVAREFTMVPVTVEELNEVIPLDAKKYQIQFDSVGVVSLEIEAAGGPRTITLPLPSKTATLTLYYEKAAPSSDGAPTPLKTLHFWLANEKGSTYSYVFFDGAKARRVQTGFQENVFQILATAGENPTAACGYSLRLSCQPQAR